MPEDVNLETYNADALTEDLADAVTDLHKPAPQAAPAPAPRVETPQDLSADI